MLKQVLCSVVLSVAVVSAFAVPHLNSKNINGFATTLQNLEIQNTSHVAVMFPTGVPKPKKDMMYYPSFDVNPTGYNIYLDASAKCHGAHYCNILSLNANDSTKQLAVYKNRDGKVITRTVRLHNGAIAHYTPGFALGDYWNPQVSWQQAGTTYTLSWVGVKSKHKTKHAMIAMANHLQTFHANNMKSGS